MSRGQILGQVFVLILAAVVFIMILLYGYNAVRSFQQRGEQVALLEMVSTLESRAKSMALDYGSVRRVDLIVPGGHAEVCFVDLETLRAERSAQDGLRAKHPLILNLALAGSQNVFLWPLGDVPIFIENIRVSQPPNATLCLPVSGGRVSVRMEGLGRRAGISAWG